MANKQTKPREKVQTKPAAKKAVARGGNETPKPAAEKATTQKPGKKAPGPKSETSAISGSHILGEICWLFAKSPFHKHYTFGDAEWMFLPPMALKQYRVFHAGKRPVGLALWAYVSEEVEKEKLLNGTGRLRPDEWKSGDRLWLVDMIAPFATKDNKMTQAMVAELLKGPFKGKTVRVRQTDPKTGKRKAVELKGA